MADTFDIEVATPERLVFREAATEAQIPCKNGYIGVLPGHAPLLSELGIGYASYMAGGRKSYFAVHGGFVEVLPDKVRVLAETVEKAEEIDLQLRIVRVVVAGDFRDAGVGPDPLRAAQHRALVQQLGRRLELLMLEQPQHERLARIVFGRLLSGIGPRQQHL